jgi:serine/threonine protein kinase
MENNIVHRVFQMDTISKQMTEHSRCLQMDSVSLHQWFDFYQMFQEKEPRLVKIVNFDGDRTIEIEKIEGFDLRDTRLIKRMTKEERRHLTYEVISLWGIIQTFTIDDHKTFLHRDFCISNLMYEPSTRRVRLIDPDSFTVLNPSEDNPTHLGNFIDTLYNMKRWENLRWENL